MSVLIKALQKAARERAKVFAELPSAQTRAAGREMGSQTRDAKVSATAATSVLRVVVGKSPGEASAQVGPAMPLAAANAAEAVSTTQDTGGAMRGARWPTSAHAILWTRNHLGYISGALTGLFVLAYAGYIYTLTGHSGSGVKTPHAQAVTVTPAPSANAIPADSRKHEPQHVVTSTAQATHSVNSPVAARPPVIARRVEPQHPQPAPTEAGRIANITLPPPMEYRFAGRLLQNGHEQFFVSKGDALIAIKPGDALGGYVVKAISASAIALVHLPTGHTQSIAVPPGISAEQPARPTADIRNPDNAPK